MLFTSFNDSTVVWRESSTSLVSADNGPKWRRHHFQKPILRKVALLLLKSFHMKGEIVMTNQQPICKVYSLNQWGKSLIAIALKL